MATKKKKKSVAEQIIDGSYKGALSLSDEPISEQIVQGTYKAGYDAPFKNNDPSPLANVINSTDKKEKEDSGWRSVLDQVGYTAKSFGSGILSGISGVFEAGTTEVANNLNKGQEENDSILDSMLYILNPTLAMQRGMVDTIQNTVNIATSKEGKPLEKAVDIVNNSVTGALDMIPGVSSAKETIQLAGKILPENADDKVMEFSDKITKPVYDIQEDLYEEGQEYGGFTQLVGSAASSVGRMIPSAIATAVTKNPTVGLGIMGVSSKGSSTTQALKKGAELNEAVQIGNTKAVIETGLEMVSGGVNIFGKGALDDIITKGIDNRVKKEIANYFAQKGAGIGMEVVEEVVTDLLHTAVDKGTVDPNASYSLEDLGETSIVTILSTIGINAITGGYGRRSYQANTARMKQNEAISKEVESRIKEKEAVGITLTNQEKVTIEKEVQAEFEQNQMQEVQNRAVEGQIQGLQENIVKKQEELNNAQDPREQQIIQEEINILNEELNEITNAQQFTDTEQNVDNNTEINTKQKIQNYIDKNNLDMSVEEFEDRFKDIELEAIDNMTPEQQELFDLITEIKNNDTQELIEESETQLSISEDYETYKNKWDGKYKPYETNTGQLSEKHYNKILQLFNENNVDTSLIDYIGSHDVYKRDSQGVRTYKTVAEYEKIANENKDISLKNEFEREQKTKEREQETLRKQEIIERDGITEQQYQKEQEATRYREEKQKELALLSREIKGKESGYHNNQKSIRAIRAEQEGKFPLTVAAKMLGVSEKSIKNNVVVSEWHHSGGEMYNEIDYYDISKYIDLADNGIDEYINDSNYQQEISNWLKMRNSTKTIDDFTTDHNTKYSISTDNRGRKLTKEQQEFFKDSKVRDENGNLLTVYHGTESNAGIPKEHWFTIFDEEKQGNNGSWYGNGFYFTKNKEHAQDYAHSKGNIYESYLNITNPYIPYKNGNSMFSFQEDFRNNFKETEKIEGKLTGKQIQDILKNNGYDGIIIGDNVIAFNSNQIKNLDNTKPTTDPDIRYSLSEDTLNDMEDNSEANAIDRQINQTMTMAEAKDMIQRAFGIGDIYDWFDGQYKNGDEWLAGEGTDSVALVIENEYQLQQKFLDKMEGLNDDYVLEDILEAYLKGTLTGKQTENTTSRLDLTTDTGFTDDKFYSPKGLTADLETYKTANQRVTKANREAVYKARADFITNAHNKGYIESLGLTQTEVNKKLRTWANYPKKAIDYSNYFNEGVSTQNRWTGIENSSILNTITISDQDLSNMVKEIKGNSNEWQRRYVTSTMLALDTHINYKELTYEFNSDMGGKRDSVLGDYSASNKTIRIRRDGQNTVAHETGHYIDNIWGEEIFGRGSLTDKNSIERLQDTEIKQWVTNFYNFLNDIENSSDIRNGYTMSSNEVFARFVARFVEWTKNVATSNRYGYESKFYQDNFTESQYREFVKLLQEKAKLDTTKLDLYKQDIIKTDKISDDRIDDIYNQLFNEKQVKKQIEEAIAPLQETIENLTEQVKSIIPTAEQYTPQRSTFYSDVEKYRVSTIDEIEKGLGKNKTYSLEELTDKWYDISENIYELSLQDDSYVYIEGDNKRLDFVLYDTATDEEIYRVEINKTKNGKYTSTDVVNAVKKLTAITNENKPISGQMDIEGNEYDLAPTSQEVVEQQGQEAFDNIADTDAPIAMENTTPEAMETTDTGTIESPFDTKDIDEVGNRKIKAYQYENPEVRPYFRVEAQNMMWDLNNTIKGERSFNDKLYYDSSGEQGFFGTTRQTTEAIAYLKDNYGYSYAQIEKGLNDIIEDNGKENNAVAKRIEFMLDERLREGYTTSDGIPIPPNQEYIKFLEEKQITEYNRANLDSLAIDENVPAEENIVVEQPRTAVEPELKLSEQVAPQPVKVAQNENTEVTDTSKETKEQEKVAQILSEAPTKQNEKSRLWARFKANFLDKGSVFESLSLKTKNRNLTAKWDNILLSESQAQDVMLNGTREIDAMRKTNKQVSKSLFDIKAEVGDKVQQFSEYLYHKHNINRMSLESNAQARMEELQETTLKGKDSEEIARLSRKRIPTNIDKASRSEQLALELEIQGNLIKDAKEYMRLSETKNKPVFGDSVTAEVSQKIVEEFEMNNPEFIDWANDVYDYNRANLNHLVANGVVSQETADQFAELYPNYVPIGRAKNLKNAINVPLDTNKTGINTPIARATGGNSDILPLFDTLAKRTLQTYRAAAKNDFGVELKNTLNSTIDTQTTNVEEILDNVDQQENLLQEGKNGLAPTFTVFENGEKVTYEITQDMFDALKPVSEGLKENVLWGVPNKISNFHRGVLTEYNPVFMLTNGIKDFQDILLNSQHASKTYSKIPEAYAQIIGKGYWYQEYMANGGQQNSYFDSQEGNFDTEHKGIYKALDLPPLKQISQLNNFIELAPRLAEYIASRETGRSKKVSMLDAARVTTNFKAGGDITKWANRNGATFLNASVQGAMQQVRNVKEAHANGLKGYANLVAKFTLASVPALILNTLLWGDDEEYEELSDYVKQSYWIVGKYGDGNFIRIPKGRMVTVVQEALNQMTNLVTGNDEADLGQFLEIVGNNIAPTNPIESNILSPILQATSNKTWYGGDLVPTRLQDLPAEEQYDESIDKLSIAIGQATGISPYKINYVLDQYSGGVGDVLLPMLTEEAEGGKDDLVSNLLAPLTNKFTVDSTMKNQSVSDFYDLSDELTKKANSSKATEEDVLRNKYLNSVKSEISELYKQKREIQSSNLSNSEKYEQVRELQDQINNMAQTAMAGYDDMTKESNYAEIGGVEYYKNNKNEWVKVNDEKEGADLNAMNMSVSDKNTYFKTKNEINKLIGIVEDSKDGITIEDEDSEEYKDAIKYLNSEKKEDIVNKIINTGFTDEQKAYMYKKFYNTDTIDIIVNANISVDDYLTYTTKEFTADYNEKGNAISGSKKEKIFDYINSLEMNIPQKVILFKMEYPKDKDYTGTDYNYDILDYVKELDASYKDKVKILRKVGIEVDMETGDVYW